VTRAAVVAPLLGLLLLGCSGEAGAGTQATSAYGEASTLCQLTDPRLPEVSGLVAVGDSMWVANDGGDELEVFRLDADCAVAETRTAPVDPYDPEDIAIAADGTVWFADAGDNRAERDTVALIALRPDGSTAVHRLSYPDGPHDSEALLLAPDGTPYLVTKEVLGVSGVYRPDVALVPGGTVPMSRGGSVALSLTGTPGGPVGRAGQLLVTGGAVSADGQAVALRTYTDAYVWPLEGSNVVGALSGAPTRVALPEATQGEAISFGADGRDIVVGGEGLPSAISVLPWMSGFTPAAAVEETPPGTDEVTTPGDESLPTATAAVIAGVLAWVVLWFWKKWRQRQHQYQ
jgi:hypothetical protein